MKVKTEQQLNEQAQRFEEQITELHSVIAELTRKLHQQKAMAIAEEDEISGSYKRPAVVFQLRILLYLEMGTSAPDDSISNVLETSETSEPLDKESDSDTKRPVRTH